MIEFWERDLDKKTYVDVGEKQYCVSTVALTIEHHGGMWYETYIFPAENGKIAKFLEVWGARYATRGEAEEGHVDAVEKLKAGKVDLWED